MEKKHLIIATANEKKFVEIKRILEEKSGIWIPVLASKWKIPFTDFPPETGKTFLENARIKSESLAKAVGQWSFGEDSGLAVEGLGGRPGVYSARYGGEGLTDSERTSLLLRELKDIQNRRAYFQTVISLAGPDGKEVINFSGKVNGAILDSPRGMNGFGYDPIFLPNGFDKTMAELTPEEKDAISHRGKAIWEFTGFSR